MPLYRLVCEFCGKVDERIISYDRMKRARCRHCRSRRLRNELSRAPGIIKFRAGMYEHLGPEPVRIESMQQLHDVCKERGLTSVYERDFGGTFGRKTGRWI